jgi:uncharacterized protein (DUF1330 family)
MAAYIVLTRERTKDRSELAAYLRLAQSTLALTDHPVMPVALYGRQEVLDGAPVEGVVILEFLTFDEAKAWYDSPAYRAAREQRFKAADYRAVIVEGVS